MSTQVVLPWYEVIAPTDEELEQIILSFPLSISSDQSLVVPIAETSGGEWVIALTNVEMSQRYTMAF